MNGAIRTLIRFALVCLALSMAAAAQSRAVAVTFDDLPRGGDSSRAHDLASVRAMTRKLLKGMEGIPLAAFANSGSTTAQQLGAAGLHEVLKLWCGRGRILGNHTYTHPDINRTPLEIYKQDILKGEPAIAKACPQNLKYFRHPFLHTGNDAETKRALSAFLAERGYRIAPVTIDNADYIFASVYAHALGGDAALAKRVGDAYVANMESIFAFFEQRSREVVGREFPQILLLHANQLNADYGPALLRMMRNRGYRLVTLEAALRDPAYRLSEDYIGTRGISWIHRWSLAKGLPHIEEPDVPSWITELREKYRRR
jgi:peptidoglycan/xylan/chitin deacetylase (PgdA/CDA1 family)